MKHGLIYVSLTIVLFLTLTISTLSAAIGGPGVSVAMSSTGYVLISFFDSGILNIAAGHIGPNGLLDVKTGAVGLTGQQGHETSLPGNMQWTRAALNDAGQFLVVYGVDGSEWNFYEGQLVTTGSYGSDSMTGTVRDVKLVRSTRTKGQSSAAIFNNGCPALTLDDQGYPDIRYIDENSNTKVIGYTYASSSPFRIYKIGEQNNTTRQWYAETSYVGEDNKLKTWGPIATVVGYNKNFILTCTPIASKTIFVESGTDQSPKYSNDDNLSNELFSVQYPVWTYNTEWSNWWDKGFDQSVSSWSPNQRYHSSINGRYSIYTTVSYTENCTQLFNDKLMGFIAGMPDQTDYYKQCLAIGSAILSIAEKIDGGGYNISMIGSYMNGKNSYSTYKFLQGGINPTAAVNNKGEFVVLHNTSSGGNWTLWYTSGSIEENGGISFRVPPPSKTVPADSVGYWPGTYKNVTSVDEVVNLPDNQ